MAIGGPTAIRCAATMPAPCDQRAGQQRERRSAGKAAELSRRPEEGTKMDGMAKRQRGACPDVESRSERARASLAPPAAPSVRTGNHGRTGSSAEPSSLKVDERLQLARKRREEQRMQLASRERGWLAREERARKFYEQHLEERRKKLEEHRQREERRRMAVEDKRRQRLKEERERYESVVRRTMERSQKAKQRVGSRSQRGGSGARSKTNAKRRSLSQWEIDLVSRLQTPTVSYLARSRSAICLSKGEASCHSVSSSAPQKLRQSCSAPPHRGVTCSGVNRTSIAGPGVNNKHIMGPGVKNSSIQGPGVNSASNTGPEVNNPSITASGVNNPDIMNLGVNNSRSIDSEVNNPDITSPGVNNPDITSPGVINPDITSPGVNNPDITSPGVINPDITSPGVINPDITGPGVINPDITSPGVNNPDITSPGVNNPDITSPGVINASQRASRKDQFQGSNGNLEKTEWKKPQSHTAAAVTANPGTAAHYKTIPSSTGHTTDKPLIRTLRHILSKPEGLPPLPEEEDPEPESLLCSTQPPPAHSVALGLCEDAGQDGPDLPEPGFAGPPLPSACPRAASELSLTGVGTQGRTSAGTTDPEEASRLLAEKRRQARIQREREGEERRQMEETGRRSREEQAGTYQQQERKRKEKEEQRKTQDEEARRQIEEDRRLQLQREVEEARQRVTAERLERESRSQREDAERQQRKKRLEEIMKRTRKTDAAEKKPATSSTTVKDILPNENVKPILSPPLEDVIMFPGPAKASKVGTGTDEDLLPAVAFKERRSLRTLAGLEEVQAHQRAEVI